MTDATSYLDIFRKFGTDLGLPKPDIEKLLETQRKNLDALGQSANVAAQGVQSVAQKQREVLEAGLREAATLARDHKSIDKVQENVVLQAEFARKVLEIAIRGAADSAATTRQSTVDAVKIIQDRVKASLEEMRASIGRDRST
jgi:phasin family protein